MSSHCPLLTLILSLAQCLQRPSASGISWGKMTTLPTPPCSRRWTPCSTTARRWSGKSLPGKETQETQVGFLHVALLRRQHDCMPKGPVVREDAQAVHAKGPGSICIYLETPSAEAGLCCLDWNRWKLLSFWPLPEPLSVAPCYILLSVMFSAIF